MCGVFFYCNCNTVCNILTYTSGSRANCVIDFGRLGSSYLKGSDKYKVSLTKVCQYFQY